MAAQRPPAVWTFPLVLLAWWALGDVRRRPRVYELIPCMVRGHLWSDITDAHPWHRQFGRTCWLCASCGAVRHGRGPGLWAHSGHTDESSAS